MTIAMLLQTLGQAEFRNEILILGREDRADTSSEHGGLLKLKEVRDTPGWWVKPVVFPPNKVGDDRSYQSSDVLFLMTPQGIAHFHFHFQQEDNRAIAGPGSGDLSYARVNRVNCVVFTSVGKGAFDVDYYTPGGAVVDLGVWRGE
jgi:hypothetical protein